MTTHPTEPADAPVRILAWTVNDWGSAWSVAPEDAAPDAVEYVRADLLTAATDPDFILAALSDVHDMDATLTDYAAAVSRAIRAAMKEPKV